MPSKSFEKSIPDCPPRKIRLLAVFNECREVTTPFENVLHVDPERFDIHVLSLSQSPEDIARTLSDLRDNPGQSTPVVTLHGAPAPHRLSWNPWRTARLLRRLNPDIIHLHHCGSGFLLALLARLLTRAAVITTVHSNYTRYRRRQKGMLLLVYKLSDAIVCNSQNTLDAIGPIRRRFFPHTPAVVIHNGVNLPFLSQTYLRPPSAPQSDAPYRIGTIGRLVPAKDHPTLLKAFVRFQQYVPRSQLVLVGDGPWREKLQRLARAWHIDQKVTFCGALPRSRTYEQLTRFDLFVMSSRWEGFGNAMVEAMLTRVPVLASRIDPLPEVLGENHGLFFTVGDPKDLSRKLYYAYTHPSEMTQKAQSAYRFAAQRYSLTQSARQYEQWYEAIVQRQVSPRPGPPAPDYVRKITHSSPAPVAVVKLTS